MKKLAFNVDLEACTLTILTNSPSDISLAGLEAEDFYNAYNRKIFLSLVDMLASGTTITIPTLVIELDKKNVEGAKAIAQMMRGHDIDSVKVALLPDYVKELKELRAIRDLQSLLEKADNINDVIAKVKQIELRLTDTKSKDLEECYEDYLLEYETRKDGKIGLDTSYKMLDELAPMEMGTMTVLAARSSIGKSAFALNLAYNVAATGKKVLFISAEMSIPRLLDRLFALITEVEAWKFRKSKADNSMQNLKELVKEFKNHFHFIYAPYADSIEICRIIKKENIREKKDLVVVDYLQYLRDKKAKGENEATRVGNMTRNFKGIAGECNLAILVLSQVNRKATEEDGGKPRIEHLRDSGAIEQDADVVMMLNRINKDSCMATLDIVKNRNGQADLCVDFNFNPRTTKFKESNNQQLPTGYKETLI